jgi:hypothetical protein
VQFGKFLLSKVESRDGVPSGTDSPAGSNAADEGHTLLFPDVMYVFPEQRLVIDHRTVSLAIASSIAAFRAWI